MGKRESPPRDCEDLNENYGGKQNKENIERLRWGAVDEEQDADEGLIVSNKAETFKEINMDELENRQINMK